MQEWKQTGQGRQRGISHTWFICLVGTVASGRHTWTHRLSMSLLVSNWILPHHLLPCPLIIVSMLHWGPSSKITGSLHIYTPCDDCWSHLHIAYLIILLPSQVPLTWATRSSVHAAENHPELPQTVEITMSLFTSLSGYGNVKTLQSLCPDLASVFMYGSKHTIVSQTHSFDSLSQ